MEDDQLKTGGAFDALGQMTGHSAIDAELIGKQLGDYRITSLIAEGGMSRVYRAERIDGSFEREVAIKLSPGSGLSDAMHGRFSTEQGVLAGLNHPNIAQLFDARVTREGWPYFVMELVDGGAIEEFCKQESKSRNDRIRLLIEIVDAVAYAHARLIVHRDIKPSNILVNENGRPKLLDFGIAKLLEGEERDLTKAGPMTPRYASPEQLLGQPITIASDIYQLGLLIYEVLVGDVLTKDEAITTAIQRAAEQKSVTIDASVKLALPRELLLIIEQCLRVLPDERYRDANALKSDLQAYVDGYPVKAAGQSWRYRVRKFVQRNRAASTAVSAAIIAVAGTTAWYTIEVTRQRDVANEQRQLAEESMNFLASFYSAANPDNAQGRELSALDMLDEGTRRIADELTEQPKIQSRLYREVAETYRRLAQFETALETIDLGMEATRKAHPDDPIAPMRLQTIRANILRQQGDPAAAAEVYRHILEVSNAKLGPGNDQALVATHNLSLSLWQMGQTESAITAMRNVLADKKLRYGEGTRETLISANVLVAYLRAVGNLDEAIAIGERYLPISRATLGEYHSTTLDFGTNLALAIGNRDGSDAAIPLLEANAEANGVVHGQDSYEYWHRYGMLTKAHIDSGRLDPWVDELRKATDSMAALRGPDNNSVLINKASLASALIEMQRGAEALDVLKDVLAIQANTIGLDHPNAFFTQVVMTHAELSGAIEGAMERAVNLRARMDEKIGEDHVLTGMLRDIIAKYQ